MPRWKNEKIERKYNTWRTKYLYFLWFMTQEGRNNQWTYFFKSKILKNCGMNIANLFSATEALILNDVDNLR